MSTTLLTPADNQAVNVVIEIKTEDLVMLGQDGLAGAEAATVEAYNGVDFTQIAVGGTNLALTVDDNVMHLRGPGKYRVNKPASAGTAHLFMYPPVRAIVSFELDTP